MLNRVGFVLRLFAAIFFVFILTPSLELWAQDSMLARTPPMGWSSWNHFGCHISDQIIRAQADAMVGTGMKAAGYIFVNIDDCWQGHRDAQGFIHTNERFPDMKALADYVHAKGLKLGIYSSPGPKTCAGYEGSFGHEEQDAQTYASWGIDFLKYDLCSLEGQGDQKAAYEKMGKALRKTGRPIVYSLCQYGTQGVWRWGASVGGNLWRTSDDIRDNYYLAMLFGFSENGLEQFAGPGRWNDPDMLEIGNGGMSFDEAKSHMSLWCILAAPLIAGNDLTKMNQQTHEILTNPEVLAVDQDKDGFEGRRVNQEGPLQVWVKPLSDGSKAVGLFNLDWGAMPITVKLNEIGVKSPAKIRDLWAHKDLGSFNEDITLSVPKHGVMLLKVQ